MNNINIEDNLKLVWDVLHRNFGGGANFRFMGFEPDDLFQVGAIGLMKAVERFNPDKGIQFSTYASSMIIGEVRRELRDNGRMVKFPRTVNEIVGKIVKQNRKDTIKLDDIVEEFEVSRDYAGMVMTRLFYNTISGEETNPSSGVSVFDGMKDESVNVEDCVTDSVELDTRLSILGERERNVVELSLKGLTQTEVADMIGISQMSVSRLLKKSVKKIENRFDNVITV